MANRSRGLPDPLLSALELDSSLSQNDLLSRCKQAIAQVTDYLHEQFRAGEETGALLRMRAQFVDALLGALWDRQEWGQSSFALLAVGGYGRGELHPHSDIDILLLLDNSDHDKEPELGGFLTLLWDVGLVVGHSVRTVAECARKASEDITILTALMEARTIRGAEQLLQEMQAAIAPERMWPSPDFYQAKLEEQRTRHAKFADTEYNLEPNVKSCPGGLRDLQIIGWLAVRHFGVESLADMTSSDFLNAEEAEILERGREFMWKVRYALHMITDREEDRLLFDHQRALAQFWGFEDGERLAVEQFMQVYYRWALALSQLNEVLILNFDQAILHADQAEEIEVINDCFHIRRGYIEARDEGVFARAPSALLEVFLLCANLEEPKGIAAPTIRLIRDHRHLIDDAFRANPINRETFLGILASPNKMSRQLRRMARFGILSQYLPEFGRIVGQMQHDLFHVYTVDAHTLEAVKNTRRFLYPDFEQRFPVSSRIARRLRKPLLLYIAALYHDIGKGRGGDHSELGALDAQRFCEDHALNRRDSELVVWLVKNHLLMSAVSQRKDISDPEVIQQFAEHVGDQEHLDYLFVLTVADINATNPTLWNAWRGSLLRQLYTETRRALERGLDNPLDKQAWINRSRFAASEMLASRGFTEQELENIWQERGEDYFLRERAEDIAWHTESIASHHDKDKPLVLVRNNAESTVANTTQIFIHARSKVQLFSTICAQLEQLGLSVHDARIYSANDGMSLDTFFVLNSDGSPIEEGGARLSQIKTQLTNALSNGTHKPQIVQRRTPRRMKSFSVPTQTQMSIDEIKQVSVLEVSSPDRPGLLARIGKIFVDYEVEIQAAKIQTLGERVEDVFFITDSKQQPIVDEELGKAIQQAICQELDERAA
ncbi:MAG: [protein-PII] uridylyltransferase [Pseudomonadota bacterium]